MDKNLTPEQDALALKALQYAESITKLAVELALPPEAVLGVFGMFAKKMIKGSEAPEDVQWAVGAFMHGMGFDVGEMHKVEPPELQ